MDRGRDFETIRDPLHPLNDFELVYESFNTIIAYMFVFSFFLFFFFFFSSFLVVGVTLSFASVLSARKVRG